MAQVGYGQRGWPEGFSSVLLSLVLQLASPSMAFCGHRRAAKVRGQSSRPPKAGGGLQTLLFFGGKGGTIALQRTGCGKG